MGLSCTWGVVDVPTGSCGCTPPCTLSGSTPAVLPTSLPHAPPCCRLPACFLAPERAHSASPGKHWPRRESGWSLRPRVGLSGREAEREPASPGRRGAVCWISSSETEPQGPASPQQKVQMAQAPYLLPGTEADQPPVQFSLSVVSDSATPGTTARQASLSITSSRSLLKLMSVEPVTPSSHLILCLPLLLLPSIPPSIRVFSNESLLRMRWPKYWSFSFSISPSKEYSGLISFRMDWFNLLAVQGTLKSLLQHHSSKASILLRSALFIVQLSHPYMTSARICIRCSWGCPSFKMELLCSPGE